MEIAVRVNVEKHKLIPAMKGAIRQSTAPKIHSFLKAVIGVMVAEIEQTAISEHDNESMNKFGTV